MGSDAENLRSKAREIEAFLKGLEEIGIDIPPLVKHTMASVREGNEIAEDAQTVSDWLALTVADMEAVCEDNAKKKYNLSVDRENAVTQCQARVTSLYLHRSTRAVLEFSNDKSLVRLTWERHKSSLKDWFLEKIGSAQPAQ